MFFKSVSKISRERLDRSGSIFTQALELYFLIHNRTFFQSDQYYSFYKNPKRNFASKILGIKKNKFEFYIMLFIEDSRLSINFFG